MRHGGCIGRAHMRTGGTLGYSETAGRYPLTYLLEHQPEILALDRSIEDHGQNLVRRKASRNRNKDSQYMSGPTLEYEKW